MPQTSGSVSGSSRSHRYRIRGTTSHVDESLFGSTRKLSTHDVKETSGALGSRALLRSAPARSTEGQDTIRIITKDLIRDLKIPAWNPSKVSIILSAQEMERIRENARIITKEEKAAMEKEQQKKKIEAMESADERKAMLRQADASWQKGKELSDLELEAQEKAQYLLEKANVMRMEQEDEIKKLNEMILDVQCQAVRDIQIQEKQQILKELQKEERRLDNMMEVERRRALEAQEQLDELRKQQRQQGRMHIMEQMKERWEEKLFQEEIKDQEGQEMLEAMEKMQMEELQALEKKKAEHRRLHMEILKTNEENMQVKERRRQEELQADRRAMEFTMQKMKREAEYEAEQKRIRREKEKEVARLRGLQERERDHKAEQDELRARRNQEAAEREWRRKEREQARRKMEVEEQLKASHKEQIMHREMMLSLEAGRKRAEFERLLRVQEEAKAREREQQERQKQKLCIYGEHLRQQVRSREIQATEQRRQVYRDGEKAQQETQRQQGKLKHLKDKKLKELKEAGLPEKYCLGLERKFVRGLAH